MKRALQLLVSLSITVVCMWWTFKDIDWPLMWKSLEEANYLWLLPYTAILLAIHVCRTIRWGALLAGLERVSFRKLNEASAIGFMMLIVLPFRLGEFARPFLIAQRSNIRRSPAMTTVVLERIVDGIIIAAALRVLLFFVPADAPNLALVRWGANLMFAVFGGGLAFLLFALWQRPRAVRLVHLSLGKFAPSLADKVAHIVDGFVGAMRQLPGPRHMLVFTLFTAGYWGLNGLGMMLMTRAFSSEIHLGLFESYLVLAVLVAGLMIPAAPGSMGSFQAAIVLGMKLVLPIATFNAHGAAVAAYANVVWLAQIAQQVGLGLLMMMFSRESFTDIAGKLSDQGTPGEALSAEEQGPAERVTLESRAAL